jgi:hypothetical protein
VKPQHKRAAPDKLGNVAANADFSTAPRAKHENRPQDEYSRGGFFGATPALICDVLVEPCDLGFRQFPADAPSDSKDQKLVKHEHHANSAGGGTREISNRTRQIRAFSVVAASAEIDESKRSEANGRASYGYVAECEDLDESLGMILAVRVVAKSECYCSKARILHSLFESSDANASRTLD